MGFDKNQIVVGIAKVYINGALVGYTTEDGVSQENSGDIVKVRAAEALGTLANYRSSMERQIKFSLMQINPDLLKWALGLDSSVEIGGEGTYANPNTLALKYSVELPTLNVMFVVNAGPESRTISYQTTAQPIESGSLAWKKTDPTTLEVTLEEIMDATNNTFGTYTFQPANTAAFSLSTFTPADEATPAIPSGTGWPYAVGNAGAKSFTWDIEFNQEVAVASLNAGNFQVFSVSAGNELTSTPLASVNFKPTTTGYDHKIVRVTPADGNEFAPDTTYIIVVSQNVMSVTGKKLAAPSSAEMTPAG